jgi:AraC family transcriptional regulator of adaptative response / DNA-3-methyladenine glycosylase II
LFAKHLGASPVAVAQTRRVLFAKQLLHETRLPMTEVAFAAGFGSVRRFNEVFQQLFDRPPSALRSRGQVALPEGSAAVAGVTVRLRYRPPYDWEAMLAFLRARAIDGVELVTHDRYTRTTAIGQHLGTIEVHHLPRHASVAATLRFETVEVLSVAVARIRRIFDLNADILAIGEHLAADPLLRQVVATRPGLRSPGAWDGFELGVRAILGQQVSVERARQLAGTLVLLAGSSHAGLPGRVFPTAAQVHAADLSALGMPGARRAALHALAAASMADPQLFHALGTLEETVARLLAVRGIGPWTAQYIALRAAREPDAFPASDVGLLRGATQAGEPRPSAAELLERAERWRPWRAYAAQHLWEADAARVPGGSR